MAIITGYIDWLAGPRCGELNCHFTFRVNSKQDAINCKKRLEAKGNSIRAAWYFNRKRMISPIKI